MLKRAFIERVQRRFSKRLPGLKKFTYEERFKFLGWPTLELRRLHTDLIWSYKILFGLVHLNSDHFFKLSPNQTRRWHVTISCQPDGRPPQPVRPWKSGRVHLADGSNV